MMAMRPAVTLLLITSLTASACTTTKSLWEDYQSYPGNKAFAIGVNEVSGAAWGAETVDQATHLAMSYCISQGGIGCEVIDVNGGSPESNRPAIAQSPPISGGETQFSDVSGSERYECFTYDYPAQHVLTLPVAPLNADVAEVAVIFHGDQLTATYMRNGLTQLWLFDENLYVQVDPDLTGKYMNFQGADEGEKRKPEAVFECKKRR